MVVPHMIVIKERLNKNGTFEKLDGRCMVRTIAESASAYMIGITMIVLCCMSAAS